MAQMVIYQNRIRRKVSNEATLEVFCGSDPEKDLVDYSRVYGDIRNVMGLACNITSPADWSGWDGVEPEDIFGDWRMDCNRFS